MARTGALDDRGAAAARTYPPRSAVLGWVLFDWAAQPYFSLITTFVFAPYFATHVASNPATGQSLWGFATAAAYMILSGPQAFPESMLRVANGGVPLVLLLYWTLSIKEAPVEVVKAN